MIVELYETIRGHEEVKRTGRITRPTLKEILETGRTEAGYTFREIFTSMSSTDSLGLSSLSEIIKVIRPVADEEMYLTLSYTGNACERHWYGDDNRALKLWYGKPAPDKKKVIESLRIGECGALLIAHSIREKDSKIANYCCIPDAVRIPYDEHETIRDEKDAEDNYEIARVNRK